MNRLLLTAAFSCAVVTTAVADNPSVALAVSAFAAIEGDVAKLETFCKISKIMADGRAGKIKPADGEVAAKNMTDYVASLGTDFGSAWDLGADLERASPDGVAYYAALQKLEGKCP